MKCPVHSGTTERDGATTTKQAQSIGGAHSVPRSERLERFHAAQVTVAAERERARSREAG